MTPHKKSKPSKHKSNKSLWLAISIIVIIIIGIGTYFMIGQPNNPSSNSTPTPTPTTSPSNDPYANATRVLLQTSVGNITLELRTDKPITAGNFENLVREGDYDGTIFHRVIAGFMIQGGAISESIPTIPDEIGNNNRNLPYTIAMAKTSAPNSATSQFFINVADNGNNPIDQAGTKFDAVYAVFGRVIAGQSVVDLIANAPVTSNSYEANSTPINPVTVIKAAVMP